MAESVRRATGGSAPPREAEDPDAPAASSFEALFEAEYPRLFGFFDRLSGDPDLAADIAQEAFVRLYRRGTPPDAPRTWLIAVGMNLYRNARNKETRRLRLLRLSGWRATEATAESGPDPVPDAALGARVRRALGQLSERDRRILLLRSEGYSYREIARSIGVAETSLGTLLARARRAFRTCYEDRDDAAP